MVSYNTYQQKFFSAQTAETVSTQDSKTGYYLHRSMQYNRLRKNNEKRVSSLAKKNEKRPNSKFGLFGQEMTWVRTDE